jgi:hypothetical protein
LGHPTLASRPTTAHCDRLGASPGLGGPRANSNKLTGNYIYNDDVGSKEGANVSTSVGRFSDRCG